MADFDVLRYLRRTLGGASDNEELQRLEAESQRRVLVERLRQRPLDEVILRPRLGIEDMTGRSDQEIVARPYTGPQTGDPVINQRPIGTYDRPPTIMTPEWSRRIDNPPYTQMPVAYQNAPPPMMPTQDDYSRLFSNLGFGGMGALY
jgi:hypothetical protein